MLLNGEDVMDAVASNRGHLVQRQALSAKPAISLEAKLAATINCC